MNTHGFFAVRPDIDSKQKLTMLSFLIGLDMEDLADFHVTLMYDPNNTETGDITQSKVRHDCQITGATILKNSVVFLLDGQTLNDRHAQLEAHGKTCAYPEYLPHVTIIPDGATQEQVDILNSWLDRATQDNKSLVFGNEYSQECTD